MIHRWCGRICLFDDIEDCNGCEFCNKDNGYCDKEKQKMKILTNLPEDAPLINQFETVLEKYDLCLVFDENMETYINNNNVYFKLSENLPVTPIPGPESNSMLVPSLNALYRSLWVLDYIMKGEK